MLAQEVEKGNKVAPDVVRGPRFRERKRDMPGEVTQAHTPTYGCE